MGQQEIRFQACIPLRSHSLPVEVRVYVPRDEQTLGYGLACTNCGRSLTLTDMMTQEIGRQVLGIRLLRTHYI